MTVCFTKPLRDVSPDMPPLVAFPTDVPRNLLLPVNSCVQTILNCTGRTNGMQNRRSGTSAPYLLCAEKSTMIDPMTHCWTKNEIIFTTFFLAARRVGSPLPPEPSGPAVLRSRDLSIAVKRNSPMYQKRIANATPRHPSPVAKILTAVSVYPAIATAAATPPWIFGKEYPRIFPVEV